MGLFDIFSNDSAEKAAALANQGAQQGYNQLSGLYDQGRDAINTGYGNAAGLYGNLLNGVNAGANAYGNAVGANGATGQAQARANFQTDPGYQFQMDQGLQALNRTHAAAGNLSSGNADTDALKFSQGLADQSYGNYVSRLAPYLNQQQLGTAGAAGVATGQGNALNQSYDLQGNAANQTQNTMGNNLAGAELNNYKVGSNLWNAIGGGLNFLSGGVGGQGGIGGLAKNAGSLFGMFK